MSGVFGLCKDGWTWGKEGRCVTAVCVLTRREVLAGVGEKEAQASYEPELGGKEYRAVRE
jgi:hypothetical protein